MNAKREYWEWNVNMFITESSKPGKIIASDLETEDDAGLPSYVIEDGQIVTCSCTRWYELLCNTDDPAGKHYECTSNISKF